MATKEEYIDVLGQMEELYYNNDNCTLAMNLFKEDINLLTRLVNEHFEERQETNLEHYYNDILKLNGSFSLINGKIGICQGICCSRCAFNKDYCQVGRVEWLKQPYKKPTYKLNKFEYDLISSTGKSKEDYIGQVGDIVQVHKTLTGNGSATNLFDIEFNDGARFCVEREQIEFVED